MHIHAQVMTPVQIVDPFLSVLNEFFETYGDCAEIPSINVSINRGSGLVTLDLRANIQGEDAQAQDLAKEMAPFVVGPSAIVIEEDPTSDAPTLYGPTRKFISVPNGYAEFVH